jgi:hypothetical protein
LTHQNPLDTGERSRTYPHAIPHLKEGAWLELPVLTDALEVFDLLPGNRLRMRAETDESKHTGGRENPPPIFQVGFDEHIAREQRELDPSPAVTPLVKFRIERQKDAHTFGG